jgi:hypothetical protein
VGVNVDRHVVPVLLLVNIDIHANTWATFFHDPRTSFLHDDRRRRGCGGWGGRFGGSGSYWRRRLLASRDLE